MNDYWEHAKGRAKQALIGGPTTGRFRIGVNATDVLELLDTLAAKDAEIARLREALGDCANAMKAWGNQEDGVPDMDMGLGANPYHALWEAHAALHWAFVGPVPEYARRALEASDEV